MNTSLTKLLGVNKFGKITDGSVKVGLSGLAAVGKDGQLRTYNPDTKEINVAPAEFAIGDFPAFIVPAEANTLKAGDLFIHDKVMKFYVGLDADGKNKVAVNLQTEQLETIAPTKSLFGFNFVGKVVSLFGNILGGTPAGADGAPTDPNMLIMALMMGDGDMFGGDGDGLDSILPLLLLSGGLGGAGGANPLGALTSNPLMLMMLMGKM